MTSETTTSLDPRRVLEEARRFFTAEDAVWAASVVDEGERHLTLATFRSRLAISVWPDSEGHGSSVRVSTLRGNEAVGKFLTWLETAEDAE